MEGHVKRLVLSLAVIALLAVPAASAFGFATFDYTGHVKGDAQTLVGFDVQHTASGHRKVGGFTVSQIPYTCSDAPDGVTTGWRFTKIMRVRSRAFEDRGDWVGLPLDPVGTVSGKLRKHGVAVGDFKLRGELAGPGTHCRTGLLDWRATKSPPVN
jgi:hypothetical protein